MKSIPISMTANYVSDWSVEDAVREFIQNALDCPDYDIHVDNGSELAIQSYGGTISEQYLLLGEGAKSRDGQTLGGFNEGFKLAMLIIARENIPMKFYNGDQLWEPVLEYSDIYQQECLHIHISDADEPFGGVAIYLELDDSICNTVEDRTLAMQEEYKHHETSDGEILLEEHHKGKIFVGGLFVDTFKSEYGFNFNKDIFPLNRDRKSLKPFDIQWQTKDMWTEVASRDEEDVAESIITSLEEGDDSFTYAEITPTGSLINAAEDLYKEKYEGKLLASDIDEYNQLKEDGNDVTYLPTRKLVNIIKQSDSYKTVTLNAVVVERKDVYELLDEWKDKWYDSMDSEMYDSFCELEEAINKIVDKY